MVRHSLDHLPHLVMVMPRTRPVPTSMGLCPRRYLPRATQTLPSCMIGLIDSLGPRLGRLSRFQPKHARRRQKVKLTRSKKMKKVGSCHPRVWGGANSSGKAIDRRDVVGRTSFGHSEVPALEDLCISVKRPPTWRLRKSPRSGHPALDAAPAFGNWPGQEWVAGVACGIDGNGIG